MNKTDLQQIINKLSPTHKLDLLNLIKSKGSAINYDQTVKKHIVFNCRIIGAYGQYLIGKVMIEPADTMFVTRARARGQGRRIFGKKFMYLIGQE
jgi:hypothetical protein